LILRTTLKRQFDGKIFCAVDHKKIIGGFRNLPELLKRNEKITFGA
jgi:hypothetical protein